MNSVSGGRREDLTARARIRDEAIRLIAEHGLRGTTIKAVAEAAEVSPALVIHHFGSKDGLRHACDEHVIESVLGGRRDVADAPSADGVAALVANASRTGIQSDYLARLLVDGGPAGDDVFDRLLAATRVELAAGRARGAMRESSDPDALATVLAATGVAFLVLRRQVERALGADPFSPEGTARLTVPTLELYTHGLYADDALLRASRDALDEPNDTTNDATTDTLRGEP